MHSCPRLCYVVYKIDKKWYRNPFKNNSQINTKLGSILHPTWLHFGRFLEAKMEPSSLQIASKINLQIDHLMDSGSDSSWDRFWPILNPNLEPKTGPRCAQDPPNWTQNKTKTYHFQPTWPQIPLQSPQDAPMDLMFIDFWLIFDTIFIVFCLISHWLLIKF